MYVCCDCGIEFDEPVQWQEYRGECWGQAAFETMYGCPICQGSFDVKIDYIDEEEGI